MNERLLERALWSVTVVGALATLAVWLRPAVRDASGQALVLSTAAAPALLDGDSLMAAAESAIDNDLFQPQRARPQAEDAISMPAIAVAPRAPAPRLTLRGVIGGPPWDVIIDGIPGRPAGTVMRDGETISGFSVRVAARDTVRVRGADTTWILVLQQR